VKEDASEGRMLTARERLHMLDIWQRSGLTTPDDLRAILAQRDLANPSADLAASPAPRAASA